MQSDYEETCNPDYRCPCNFNGFPTYGNCGALVAYYVREANYGDVKLDGHSVYQTYINLMGNYFDLHLKRK